VWVGVDAGLALARRIPLALVWAAYPNQILR
jgi:hypothetical protein